MTKLVIFELTMPNRGSWNGAWSGEMDLNAIIKRMSDKKAKELDGESFYYRWDDGWGANVSCRIIDGTESRKLRKRIKGFCGYDWMVTDIICYGEIRG